MATKLPIKRALISTSNKFGLVDLALQLSKQDIEIIATGGTAELLKKNKIPVTEVANFTGFPEILGGRVKTLHPKIHGGILARRGTDDPTLQQYDISLIDMVVVNLYPFSETIANKDCQFADAIEQIDIGGPTMLRAAAKNHDFVTAIVDPYDYGSILDEITKQGNTTLATRRRLAQKAFAHTAAYDAAIANYLLQEDEHETKSIFPNHFHPHFQKKLDLRYGENPHQKACFYSASPAIADTLASAKLLQGKPLSYNNLLDADAALNCVRALDPNKPSCVIVKHATPCGVASKDTLLDAYQAAFTTDPVSAFGGIVAVNHALDLNTTQSIIAQQFVEVLIAPSFSNEALQMLASKPNLRALSCGDKPKEKRILEMRSLSGGLIVQQQDCTYLDPSKLVIASKHKPTHEQLHDLLFAWQVVQFVKSNGIVYAKDQMTLGIGSGQTSRVFSAKIAILKAQEASLSLEQAVMASDAFFPFADGIEVAAKAGIKAIIQPGGSKRDNEVIAAANKAGIVMVLTGMRHFKH